jgi:hypothetical protein
MEMYFRELHITLSNSDSVYKLTVVSQKNIVKGPKTALEVQQDVLT